jgi:ATP-dependent Clp protease ATP-binding subunit ClpX
MDGVKLKFQDEAIKAIAKEALRRKLGARGLRAILEDTMLDLMYEVPSQREIKEIVVYEDTITKGEQPIVVYEHTKAESA